MIYEGPQILIEKLKIMIFWIEFRELIQKLFK